MINATVCCVLVTDPHALAVAVAPSHTWRASHMACFVLRSGEFDNAGAMMLIDAQLHCSFLVLAPK